MLRRVLPAVVGVLFFGAYVYTILPQPVAPRGGGTVLKSISLPAAKLGGDAALSLMIARRRSIRQYTGEALRVDELSQIVWAAQGVTESKYGLRTAPSAGGTYPIELYLVAKSGGVSDLDAGVYHYAPRTHELELLHTGDFAAKLRAACVDQAWVEEAAINVVLTAAFERTTTRYGSRGIQYAFQETGHVGQNIYLAAASMDIGTSVIGAFDEDEVRNILGVGQDETPLYVFTVGKTACYDNPRLELGFCR